jgi:hypothetical protein
MYAQSVVITAIGLLFLSLGYQLVRTYWRLKDIPGPFWAKLTNLPRVFWVKTRRSHEILWDLHEKYGECVRLGPNMVAFSDPALIPNIYPIRPGFPKVCAPKYASMSLNS